MLLTSKVSKQQVQSEPFPHLVVPNALEPELLRALMNGLPPFEELAKGMNHGSNRRLNYSATNIAFNSGIPQIWKDFVQAHLSQKFLDEIIRLFAPFIPAYFPDFSERFGVPEQLKAGIRPVDQDSDAKVLLDCQLAVNTPVTIGGTTVRAPHVDCPKKLFIGLFYLRLDDDDSQGGDLEIYRPKAQTVALDETRTAAVSDMELVRRIPYEQNTLVLFLNTPKSFHGVTVRSRTPHHRLFVNLLGEMKEPLFTLDSTGRKSARSTASAKSFFSAY